MELVAVIVIMGIIAAVAMRSIGNTLETVRVDNTKREMEQLKFAISGNPSLYSNGMRSDFGYVGDVGSLPSTLTNLVTDPGYSTWDGPYVSSDFSEAGDEYKRDAWGALYTYNNISIQSNGGGGGTMTRPICSTTSELTSNSVSGSVTDAAGNPPGDSSSAVSVILTFPDGSGGTTDSSITVSPGGSFSFSNSIPIGNHMIKSVYSATNDTVTAYVSVMPNGESFASLRLPGAQFAASGGGGGGSGSVLEYVAGSAKTTGGQNDNVEFDSYNGSPGTITIPWIIATYTHSPTAFIEKVKWNNSTEFDSDSPRAASGDIITFSSAQAIAASATETIKLQDFRDAQSGGASNVDMTTTDFTITFSDGSVITFNSGS